ncbi:MAG: hypothetical protein B7Z80_23775 [Rhodospirillales bacterium 20-64-7]|nr:MAG: hypothetical protein B7Z80_23775 [Rhodospirillales bacterium 20-64-7]HQT79205.1 hypothetical protein [Rhodopila sp.]
MVDPQRQPIAPAAVLRWSAKQIVGQTFRLFTAFTATALIYLLLTSAISAVQVAAERRFSQEREPAGSGMLCRRRTAAAPPAIAPTRPTQPEPDDLC